MAHESTPTTKALLPLTVITTVDLSRLSRELIEIENFSLQSNVRDAGKQPALPRTSRNLEEMASQDNLNLLIEADRQILKDKLDSLGKHAPVLHISFAADPSPSFLIKLITWLRSEIHPATLIRVGLQPGIAAGCIVRTDNKYFDFSLRKHFTENTNLLIKALTE